MSDGREDLEQRVLMSISSGDDPRAAFEGSPLAARAGGLGMVSPDDPGA